MTNLQQNLGDNESKDLQKKARKEVWFATNLKLEYWKQRVKSNWDELGDQPTSYFYKSVKTRQGRNVIKAIKIFNGEWTNSQDEIKLGFVNYFSKLFEVTAL